MYLFRTILFLPSVLSGVAVAVLCGCSCSTPTTGVVNQVLRAIGISDPPRWLPSPTGRCPAVVLMGMWGVGGGAIIYLAGLQNIPPHLYEAAEIDGAGTLAVVPAHHAARCSRPTLLFTLLIGLIGAFQVFDIAYVLGGSRGGSAGIAAVLPAQHLERGVPQRPVRLRVGAGVGARVAAAVVIVADPADLEPLGLLRIRRVGVDAG